MNLSAQHLPTVPQAPAPSDPFARIGRLIKKNPDPTEPTAPEPIKPLLPRLSQNLISLYRLQETAASVARYKPGTGAKNGLRKSYSGLPTRLGLSGKNKEVNIFADEPRTQESLLELLSYDRDWASARWAQVPLEQGLSLPHWPREPDALQRKLDRAFLFDPAQRIPILKGEKDARLNVEREWSMALGHEIKLTKAKQPGPVKTNGLAKAPLPTPSAIPSRVASPKPSTPTASRPQRKTAGQKRSYDDEVREGEHGYYDGASDGASSDGGSQRKKRKSAAHDQAGSAVMYGPGSIHR